MNPERLLYPEAPMRAAHTDWVKSGMKNNIRNRGQAMGSGLAIGIGLGSASGVVFHNLALGTGPGLALGAALGLRLPQK